MTDLGRRFLDYASANAEESALDRIRRAAELIETDREAVVAMTLCGFESDGWAWRKVLGS